MDNRTYQMYTYNTFKNEQNDIFTKLSYINNSDNFIKPNKSNKEFMNDLLKTELDIKDIPKIKTIDVNKEFIFITPDIEIKPIEEITPIEKIEIDPIETTSKFAFLTDPYLELEEENIKPIKQDLDIFELELNFNEDLELEQYKPIKQEYSNNQLANMLNEKTNRLFDIRNTYDNLVYNHSNFNEIMLIVYNNNHKSKGSKNQIEKWIEKFPNEIDRKIKAIEKENRKKNRSKKQNEYYDNFNKRPSTLRKLNIIRKMNSLGKYGFNEDSIIPKMKKGLTNDEIIEDLLIEIKDKFGNDHDMIEFDENKEFQEHFQKYNNGDYEDHE